MGWLSEWPVTFTEPETWLISSATLASTGRIRALNRACPGTNMSSPLKVTALRRSSSSTLTVPRAISGASSSFSRNGLPGGAGGGRMRPMAAMRASTSLP
jgi:hypothetical protein